MPNPLAVTAQRCAVSRALAMAGLCESREGAGWVACRTGAQANDLNVIVSEADVIPDRQVRDDLLRWFGDLPASWLVSEPSALLTQALEGAGWLAERTGRVCGRAVRGPNGIHETDAVAAVTDAADLDRWVAVAAACGWIVDADDAGARARLLRHLLPDDRFGAWVLGHGDEAVGMVSGWLDGSVVEIVDVAVLPGHRRAGFGRTLVAAVERWAAGLGADTVVAQPSPDGWRLLSSLGFVNVQVVPEVCFYRP